MKLSKINNIANKLNKLIKEIEALSNKEWELYHKNEKGIYYDDDFQRLIYNLKHAKHTTDIIKEKTIHN